MGLFFHTGTCLSIAAGITTIATAGAAIPFLIGSLMWTGVGIGAVGAGLKIGGGIHGSKAKKILKNLEEAIKEDLEAHEAFKGMLLDLKINPEFTEKLCFKVLTASISSGGNAVWNFAEIVGVQGMISLFETIIRPLNKTCCSNPILQELIDNMITAIGGTLTSTFTEITEQATSTQAGKIAAEAVKAMEEGFVKKQAHSAALLAAEELLKSSGDDVLGVAAAAGTNEAIKTAGKVASEVAKQTSDDVVLAAAKVATNEATKVASSEAAKLATTEAAKVATNEATKVAASETAKIAASETAKVAASETAKVASTEAAKVAASETAKVASTEAAKAATKEAANEAAIAAANKAAITAAEKTAETCAKIAGRITIGLGALFIVWDVYNTVKDGQKKSLGNTLRELAEELEKQTDPGTEFKDLRD